MNILQQMRKIWWNFKKISNQKNAHFGIVHYAGTVSYNVTGWLEKNKDPLNDTVVEIMKNGSNKLVVHIFADHPGISTLRASHVLYLIAFKICKLNQYALVTM